MKFLSSSKSIKSFNVVVLKASNFPPDYDTKITYGSIEVLRYDILYKKGQSMQFFVKDKVDYLVKLQNIVSSYSGQF